MPHRRRTPSSLTPIERGLIDNLDAAADRARNANRYPSRGSGGGVELGPAGKKIVAMGLVLFGIWIAPGAGAPLAAWIIAGPSLAFGTIVLIIEIIKGWGDGWYPFEDTPGARGRRLRILWAFRPRIWVLVWVVIVGIFVFYGSPHLRMQYGPSGCDYYGLNGWESYGVAGRCPLVKAFRLR